MPESVYPAICGSFKQHDEHSWREGFLWHRKVTCLGSLRIEYTGVCSPNEIREMHGYDEAFIPMSIILPGEVSAEEAAAVRLELAPKEKHFFELKDEFSFGPKKPEDVLWECKCNRIGHYYVMSRDLLWNTGITYDVY